MSLALSFQALPADCDIVERARRDPAFAASVQFLPHWFGHDPPSSRRLGERRQGESDPAWDWCCHLAASHFDLHARRCELGVHWDVLRYVLSPVRRGEAEGADLSLAFGGGEPLASAAVSTQGIPVRLLSPDTVQNIARCLEGRSLSRLAADYDAPRMAAAAVYKLGCSPEYRREIAARLADFQAFFATAAARGDLAIACMN